MKKVLLITDVDFWQKNSGHRTRIAALIKYLSGQTQLTIVIACPVHESAETIIAGNLNAEFHVLEKNGILNSTGYARRLKKFIKGRFFDAVIIEYIHCSYFLNVLEDGTNVILDAHDIISDRAEEFKKHNYAGALYEISRETEVNIFNVFDHVMVLCQPDYDRVKQIMGAGNVLLCPHPVDYKQYVINEDVKNIVFVGSAYVPNVDAINFFINECWPSIAAKYPVLLNIYGTVCHELSIATTSGIRLNGFVTDTDQIYAGADIVINPVRFGAGLKIKNIEALAYGVPLITTTHGARGLEAGLNNCMLIADTAHEFTDAVELLINDFPLRRQFSFNAQKLIETHFSAKKCFDPLMAVL
ncbi:glycosyltransferase family 4 protein [Mucilaginibacter angelicae]|uniref:Glycosyltransferase family 4 protein n=1 Tax=Mucilaginibacter angelicae TaxID=869718 RepID=A0ABV6L2L9_9SPHI